MIISKEDAYKIIKGTEVWQLIREEIIRDLNGLSHHRIITKNIPNDRLYELKYSLKNCKEKPFKNEEPYLYRVEATEVKYIRIDK